VVNGWTNDERDDNYLVKRVFPFFSFPLEEAFSFFSFRNSYLINILCTYKWTAKVRATEKQEKFVLRIILFTKTQVDLIKIVKEEKNNNCCWLSTGFHIKKIALLWRSIYGIWTWIWYWKLKFLNHVPLQIVMLKIYASVSHAVCRDTQVWC
jgi:hypothetical protein